ncbi:HAAS signaling domain-containing protein [Kitasatospora sp. NPDC096147]|uniref:HAAS signaling domain-containing protein n=1 Tax=Kitasatospora sp. NPDC096147 TaxID=3364093 RepID=UPI00380352E3
MTDPTARPDGHPLVREFLDAVTRLTATLPRDRQRELLADLGEHIEVALSEAGTGAGADEPTVRRVLDRLGTPRQIADAALAEEGRARPVAESTRQTLTTLLLAALVFPLLLVPAVGPGIALVAAIVAGARVARSSVWTAREKKRAVLLLLCPVLVAPLAIAVVALAGRSGLTPAGLLAGCAVGFVPTVLAVVLLARSAARVRAAAAPA